MRNYLHNIPDFGIPYPDEFCSEKSRAILNTAAQVYCNCNDIDEYADFMKDNISEITTRIRMDNAHFSGTYRKLFKSLYSRGVHTFYMAAIGQLILAMSIEETVQIIHALFIVAICPRIIIKS